MTDTPRCEPPPEWRDRDGWHWITMSPGAKSVPLRWGMDEWGRGLTGIDPALCYQQGWRYVAPVTPAAEVEALRTRVAELEAALRSMFEFASIQWRTASDDDKVSMITTRYEDRTREEIFESARAALTKATPNV